VANGWLNKHHQCGRKAMCGVMKAAAVSPCSQLKTESLAVASEILANISIRQPLYRLSLAND